MYTEMTTEHFISKSVALMRIWAVCFWNEQISWHASIRLVPMYLSNVVFATICLNAKNILLSKWEKNQLSWNTGSDYNKWTGDGFRLLNNIHACRQWIQSHSPTTSNSFLWCNILPISSKENAVSLLFHCKSADLKSSSESQRYIYHLARIWFYLPSDGPQLRFSGGCSLQTRCY